MENLEGSGVFKVINLNNKTGTYVIMIHSRNFINASNKWLLGVTRVYRIGPSSFDHPT